MIELTEQISDNYLLIKFNGRIDSLKVRELEIEINKYIENSSCSLIFDLNNVSYISSAGLRLLIIVSKKLSKIQKELLLITTQKQILEILKLSGLSKIFKVYNSMQEILNASLTPTKKATEKVIINGISFEKIDLGSDFGKIEIIGNNFEYRSSYLQKENVNIIDPNEIKYAIGLGALGQDFEEYKFLFGETIIINGNFYNLPATERPIVDYALKKEIGSQQFFNFLNGLSFVGKFDCLLKFDKTIEITNLIESIYSIAKSNLFGIVILAESNGIFSINLKKSLYTSFNKDKQEVNFLDKESFVEYFNFNLDPIYFGNNLIAVGVAQKEKIESYKNIFPEELNYHLHAAIFEKNLLNLDINNFDSEIERVQKELDVISIQHLLSKSELKKGIIGIINLKD